MNWIAKVGMVLAAGAAVSGGGCASRVASNKQATPPTAVAVNIRRQILNAADAGEGDPVANRLRARVAADPADVGARLALAERYGKRGFPELELEHLRLAAERFPASGPVQMALAQALRAAGQPLAAAESLSAFLTSNPAASGIEALNLIGICLDEAGQWKTGEQAFRRAVAAAPHLDYLHNNLGYNLLQQQRPAEAAAEFREALRLNPRSETARNNLGLAAARIPGLAVSEALQHFQSLTDAASAHNNLAAALIEQGRHQESRALLEAALGYNRGHAPALANLKLLSELDGKPIEVRPVTRRRSIWLQPLAGIRWVLLPGSEKQDPAGSRYPKGD